MTVKEIRDQRRRATESFYHLMDHSAPYGPRGDHPRYIPVSPRCNLMGHVMDFWRVEYARVVR